MESALTTLILTTVVLFAALTLTDSYFATEDQLWQTRALMDMQSMERANTAIELVASSADSSGSGIELTFRNVGSTKLSNFDRWDLIVQHSSASGIYSIQWLPHSTAPTTNEWTVAGIYLSADAGTAEVFEPNIWNPGEELLIQATVTPPVGPSAVNWAILAVEQGNSYSAIFTRE